MLKLFFGYNVRLKMIFIDFLRYNRVITRENLHKNVDTCADLTFFSARKCKKCKFVFEAKIFEKKMKRVGPMSVSR